jgi:hypothetical protein
MKNVQPYLTPNWIISLQCVYPSTKAYGSSILQRTSRIAKDWKLKWMFQEGTVSCYLHSRAMIPSSSRVVCTMDTYLLASSRIRFAS